MHWTEERIGLALWQIKGEERAIALAVQRSLQSLVRRSANVNARSKFVIDSAMPRD